MADDHKEQFKAQALQYHLYPVPGKIAVTPTKALATQRDLALAYSPGVAYACEAIVEDANNAAAYTSRSNLVAVISNGTAVLGLGAIGPLASKPVMEGKGVLFKKFAGIDVFDIEVQERDPDKLVEIIAALEPTFGGVNLEDIKAPECFAVETKLKARMKIPVFHDDQHGTAIIAAAAILNGLEVVDKAIDQVRLVCNGAGAAGIACLDLLVSLGMKKEHIVVCDSKGVIYQGRGGLDDRKAGYASDTDKRTLADAVDGADIFLGVSGPGLLTQDMVRSMADRPLILALANPVPEIMPEEAQKVRPDAILATGRSDYPNQVNNVLCFPYLFRGALDVGATQINETMKLAVVKALAAMAKEEPPEEVVAAYGGQAMHFGPGYLIPKPFDTRLILELPVAVARAAMESGVATRPIEDFKAYQEQLAKFVFRSGMVMKPVFERAKADPKRVVFTEGEDERVLRAVQTVIDEGLAEPLIIGRRDRVMGRIQTLGLHIEEGRDFQFIDPQDNPYYDDCWQEYHRLRERRGVEETLARNRVNTRTTVLGALLVRLGHADAMICGTLNRFNRHLDHVFDVLGLAEGHPTSATLNMLITNNGTFFIADTNVNLDPTPEELVDITLMAADWVRRFGIHPKVALLSHSNFGSRKTGPARKMAAAAALLRERAPELESEGEMQADTALSEVMRQRTFPSSRLGGSANLLIMPNVDAANISFNLLRMVADGVAVGPILMGCGAPAHVLTKNSTVRRIINMTAVAVVDAQDRAAAHKE